MRFINLLLVAFSALAVAQNPNPIVPLEGTVTAGQPTTIKWTPTTEGTITLSLRSGPASNLGPPTVIASNIPNSGSYTWTPSPDLTSASNYAIQITSDANPTTQVNYSPQFAISGSSASTSASTTSRSNTTSASSTTNGSSTTGSSATTTTTTTTSSSTTTSARTSTSASKTASAVPGSTSNAAHKLGHGFAAVVGIGALVAAF